MLAWLNLLTLIKYFIDGAIAAYKLVTEKMAKKKEDDHDQALKDLKDAETEEQQKDATRRLGRNP